VSALHNQAEVTETDGVWREWTRPAVRELYQRPLLDLVHEAQQVHRKFHAPGEVQLCRLLSIKTGGCPEDCAYCPQSAHYQTGVERQELMSVMEVRRAAELAYAEGATRFCMGAAWREVRDGQEFETVLEMVRSVASLGLEVCCTLGMLSGDQARRLAAAGLTAYNHNLDTSPEFYGQIITTRRYHDRLRTIESVRNAGISVCCGGIIGMGESDEDRIGLLHQLASLRPHPESVPINMLVRVEGTPLADEQPVDSFSMVRMIAAARLLMPASRVRLSAGRRSLSREAAALCFLAGANSIFVGEKLLTTPNPERDEDNQLFRDLGLRASTHGPLPG
jgi:biotin synthase